MPSWYFKKSNLADTPSFRDGIESEKEARYRREGARFVMDIGNQIGLRYDTMATGIVFFHRFYLFHSFNEFPRYMMATCCLFLAGKVEETPKKCKDLVKIAKQYLEKQNLKKHSDMFTEESVKEIMIYERILLQTIKFDLQVDHPYGYLVKYAKSLKGDQEKIRSLVQMAWGFINDSYCTTLCLQWEPEIIAIALMYLSSKLSKLEITDWIDKKDTNPNWWDQFVEGLDLDILEDICHQVLDLYQQQQQPQSQNKQNVDRTNSNSNLTPNKRKSSPQSDTNNSPTSAKQPRTFEYSQPTLSMNGSYYSNESYQTMNGQTAGHSSSLSQTIMSSQQASNVYMTNNKISLVPPIPSPQSMTLGPIPPLSHLPPTNIPPPPPSLPPVPFTGYYPIGMSMPPPPPPPFGPNSMQPHQFFNPEHQAQFGSFYNPNHSFGHMNPPNQMQIQVPPPPLPPPMSIITNSTNFASNKETNGMHRPHLSQMNLHAQVNNNVQHVNHRTLKTINLTERS